MCVGCITKKKRHLYVQCTVVGLLWRSGKGVRYVQCCALPWHDLKIRASTPIACDESRPVVLPARHTPMLLLLLLLAINCPPPARKRRRTSAVRTSDAHMGEATKLFGLELLQLAVVMV